MPRKYKVLRLSITNTLYRRYTNPNRKFTPRSIRTKYLNMRLDKRKRHYYTTTPHSVRCSRIYHIKGSYNLIGKVGKPDGDIRFDFSSHNAELLKVVANSVSSKQIAGVVISDNNGIPVLNYMYPFVNGVGDASANKLVTEISTRFYPGIYFSRGIWFWTDHLSKYLTEINGYTDKYNNLTTDYTESDETSLSIESSELQNRKFFIFIPYTAIETPILQAYLPLTYSMERVLNLKRLNDSPCMHLNFNIQWMGRGFDPTFITYNSIIIYTGEYTAADSSQYAGSPSTVENALASYLTEYTSQLYRPTSFTWVILETPEPEWSDSVKITPEGIIPDGYKLRESSSIIPSTPVVISDFSSFTCTLKNMDHARLGLRIVFTKENSPDIHVLVGVKIDYTPVTQQDQSSNGIIATNKNMNRELASIVYANMVPTNTGFHHLARVSTLEIPEFFSNPNNPS